MTTVVVRTFCVESEEERRSWVQAIESVKKKLDEESMETEQTEQPDKLYVDMFGRRGTSRGKVVSYSEIRFKLTSMAFTFRIR